MQDSKIIVTTCTTSFHSLTWLVQCGPERLLAVAECNDALMPQ